MSRTLDYFTDFLDNPDVYDDGQYRMFFDEWLIYLEEHEKTVNFLSEEWRERRERLHRHYEKRLHLTPEIKNEYEEISLQLENVSELDDNDAVALFQKHLDFIKKYQHVYRFADKVIQRAQQALESFKQSIEKCLIAEEKARQSKIVENDAMNELEEAMVEEYERTGKMPVLTFARTKKKHTGN